MFFSSEFKLPFDSVKEVMMAYPSWKLQMRLGNEIYFIPKALEGDKEYKAFYDRVQSNPGIFQIVGWSMHELHTCYICR